MTDPDFIAAMQIGLPPIIPPDPLVAQEAVESVCAEPEDEA